MSRSRSTGASDTATAAACVRAGANLLVAGSAVFGSADPGAAYRAIADAASFALGADGAAAS